MKKFINYLFIMIFVFFLFKHTCLASTNTYVRTDSDMKVPKDVVVDSKNHDEIMSTPSVSASEKIYDFADLLTVDQEKKLYDKVLEYNKTSKYDAVIVTTKDLNGKSISNYTYNFYDYNDFSKEGVIFVIYIENGKPTIFMGNCAKLGSKIFDIYDTKVVNSTLKYLYDNSISKGNYYEASYNFIKIINGFYVQKQTNNLKIDEDGKVVKTIPLFEVFIISFAITFIIVIITVTKSISKSNHKSKLEDCVNKSTLLVECQYDNKI